MHRFTLRNWLLAALMLLTPWVADAAGLGRLTVLSSLGQPLLAEIELVAVQKEELASLSVRLASADAYRQADLQYNSIVTGLRFSIEKRPNGQPYIKVTTARPVNEFVVDMLVELNWAAGRLMREYRVLLDPPAVEGAQPAPPQARPAPVPQPLAAAPAAVPAPAPAAPGSYGPIQRGETLSRIARTVKPEGVTLEQMLVGLFRSNPDAFIRKNMNLVRSGKILQVPKKEEVAAIPQQEAMREYRAQVADWGAYRQKVADAAATVPETRSAASGRITARVEDKAGGEAKDVVRLSKGEPPGGAAPGQKPRGADRIRALEEEIVSREKALNEANERIAQLEKTIKDMQRLVEIKSAGMAAAQQQAEQKPAPAAAATPPAPKPEEAKPAAAVPEKPAVEAKKAEAPKPAPKPKAAPAPSPEPELLDVVMENWPVAAAGGGVLVLVGFWLARRRRASGAAPAEERTAPTFAEAAPAAALAGGAAAAVATVAEPAAAASAAPAQPAAAAGAEEVDPLEEANVYLAHGRDAQAEATLTEALARDPTREDIHAKLLTIYAGRNDRAAFARQAGEFQKLTGGKGDNWLGVAAMGLALDPQNPLYSGGREAPGSPEPAPAEAAPADLDFNLDLAVPEPAGAGAAVEARGEQAAIHTKPAAEPEPPVAPLMPDFKLEVPSAGEAQTAPAAEASALDFNIELPKIEVPAAKEPGPTAAPEATDDAGLNFKVDLGEIDLSLDEKTREAAASAGAKDAHWYDVQAKFDLAKAYQEMGHKADARNILEEVIREGDGEQQVQAKALLRELT